MIRKKIEDITAKILAELGISELPIPVKKIAEMKGLIIHSYDLGENISGVLVINNNKGVIGLNPTESPVRKRFTIAHELGHYILHGGNKDSLFVDKEFKVLFRDQSSSNGDHRQELEANAFAAAILMPADILKREIGQLPLDLTDEDIIKSLAQKFEVSSIAMTYRISNLELQ
jgi:Zn-dependent peptidase ImmA (M78 family)